MSRRPHVLVVLLRRRYLSLQTCRDKDTKSMDFSGNIIVPVQLPVLVYPLVGQIQIILLANHAKSLIFGQSVQEGPQLLYKLNYNHA